MEINNQDIIRMTRQLRDEENQQLHVRPWKRRRHFSLPSWLVTIPAAAAVGFFLGVWTNSQSEKIEPLTAIVDTVYVSEGNIDRDTVAAPSTPVVVPPSAPKSKPVRAHSRKKPQRSNTEGRSMIDDKIRYDLLVKN